MDQKRLFGTLPDGQPVWQYTLTDGRLSCDILSYGATLRTLQVPAADGTPRDVVLGFDTLSGYLAHTAYFGATVGRFANRIAGASFRLGDTVYPLSANEGKNHLHGGSRGFDKRLWTAMEHTADTLTLVRMSPDGEEGYPGTLYARVRYVLRDGALSLHLLALTDRDTLCSLTNHSYFNLDGHASGSILRHSVQLLSDAFTPADASAIPDGRILPVEGTPMDLRNPRVLGELLPSEYPPLKQARGFDHNYVLPGSGLRQIASVQAGTSGIRMRVFTTQPGVQLYTGNFLHGCPPGKGGALYENYAGLCLETQGFPDAPHHAHFPSALLKNGDVYQHTTVFDFSGEAGDRK